MSRTIVACEAYQTVVEMIKSMDECRFQCNDVCCNDRSDQCGCIVDIEFCKNKCMKFEREDGIIED